MGPSHRVHPRRSRRADRPGLRERRARPATGRWEGLVAGLQGALLCGAAGCRGDGASRAQFAEVLSGSPAGVDGRGGAGVSVRDEG